MRTGKLFNCKTGCVNHNNLKKQDERGFLSNKNSDGTGLRRSAGFRSNLPRARGGTKSFRGQYLETADLLVCVLPSGSDCIALETENKLLWVVVAARHLLREAV